MKIDSYKFGKMVVEGVEYEKDLIILPGRILPNWRRKTGHIFTPEDFVEVLTEDLEVIVLGLGAYGLVKVESELMEIFRSKGVECAALPTGEAVKVFNEKAAARKTAGAFHLTC